MTLTASVVSRLLGAALRHPAYGCVNPTCWKATVPLGNDAATQRYTPGGLLHLDETVRRLLTSYYAETVDVIDAVKSTQRVWEVAFLGEVLAQLGRPSLAAPEAVIYHLDYHELNNWSLGDPAIVRRSVAIARRLAGAGEGASLAV
jgi:hypothetical protein